MIIREGTLCKYIGNSNGFFTHGDLVIAIETDDCPYCVLKSEYRGPLEECDYDPHNYEPVTWDNLEVL